MPGQLATMQVELGSFSSPREPQQSCHTKNKQPLYKNLLKINHASKNILVLWNPVGHLLQQTTQPNCSIQEAIAWSAQSGPTTWRKDEEGWIKKQRRNTS